MTVQQGERLNKHELLTDLRSRRGLYWGRLVHAISIQNHDLLDMYVVNALINMYRRHHSMADAQAVFNSVVEPDVVTWTNLLLGYAQGGKAHEALELYSSMKEAGYAPDSVTYLAVLRAWTSIAMNGNDRQKKECLERVRQLHFEIRSDLSFYLKNMLIYVYSKCGSILDACSVFNSITKPDVVSWTNIILGYAENGQGHMALQLFSKMKEAGFCPDSVTYVAALKACTSIAINGNDMLKKEYLQVGREIHSNIGCHLDQRLQNTLIDMYSNCGSMPDARAVFDSMSTLNVVSWNALLSGYAENGEEQVALYLFSGMKAAGYEPNSVTYLAVLKACSSLAENRDGNGKRDCLERGRQIHSEIGDYLNQSVQNSLVNMYSKCSSMPEARLVFESIPYPDMVSWTNLVLGYAENGDGSVALDLFSRMKAAGCAPSSVTYISVLKACTSLAVNEEGSGKKPWLERGREIHSEIGLHLNLYLQNTLIDMYANCCSMVDAQSVFDSINSPDVVSWNTLLSGYADNGEGDVALDLFSRMKATGIIPNSVTYIAAVKACGLVGALVLGRKFHLEITEFNSKVVTCLVDFYAKCGSLVESREIFELHSRNRAVSTWNALLAGYSRFGDNVSAFNLFEAMEDECLRPDAVTFVCLLLCCSHAGLIQKARVIFEAMPLRYGVTPTVVHYTCMVDVLGRGNQINEALEMIRVMPYSANAAIWRTLLASCRKWKNTEIGREAFQALADLDKNTSAPYLLMASLYGEEPLR